MLNYDIMANQTSSKSIVKSLYSLTYNGQAILDRDMANYLNISYSDYIYLITSCGAINVKNEYYFKNENDVLKAMVTLKLIM